LTFEQHSMYLLCLDFYVETHEKVSLLGSQSLNDLQSNS